MDPAMDAAHRGTAAPAPGSQETESLPAAVAQRDAAEGAPARDDTTVVRGGGNHIVVRGETLWSIAERTYGHGRYWLQIRNANHARVFGGSHLIHPGVELVLPVIEVSALETMRNFARNPEALRDVAVSIPEADHGAFLAGLSADEQEANARMLQLVELMRSTGMTLEEMQAEQRRFIEGEAARLGLSAGEYVRQQIASRGYGGGTATWWPSLTRTEQNAWTARFRAVVARLRSEAPADVQRIIRMAESHGGGFRWDPEQTEILGAFAYTRDDWSLHCGQRFVEAAEADLARVYPNVLHEMGGHNVYGEALGFPIMEGAVAGLPAAEQTIAHAGGNSMYSAYSYMESEVFAELYEWSYDNPENATDHPFAVDPNGRDTTTRPDGTRQPPDIPRQLQRIREAFAPRIAEGLVRGLWRRVAMDATIRPRAKELFRRAVTDVFGITL
jgi:hypothetical protein